MLGNTGGANSLSQLTASLGSGASAGSLEEVAAAELVFLAVPFSQVETLSALTEWKGKVVVDATNNFGPPPSQPSEIERQASSEINGKYLEGARIVKAFNTLFAEVLKGEPNEVSGRRIIFLSGDYPSANSEVAEVIEKIGFAAIDLGPLANGKLAEPGGPFSGANLLKID